MTRRILGAIAGIVAWIVFVVAFNTVMRALWAEYAAVEQAMAFTLPMMAARLSMSAIGSVVSGFVAAFVARERSKSALLAGGILLLVFIPIHVSLWTRFPVWYHLTFLVSLPIVSVLGGQLFQSESVKLRDRPSAASA
jgi:hypothetical protein